MDFSILSDEQLIELIKGALAETIKRGQTVIDAAREVMLDEKREAEIKARAAEKAKNRIADELAEKLAQEEEEKIRQNQRKIDEKKKADEQKRLWAKKKDHATRMIALLPMANRDIWVNVWKSGAEKRVYINDGEPFGKRTSEVCCLYVTGNSKYAPGSMTKPSYYFDRMDDEQKANFIELVKEVGDSWNVVKFSCTEAADYNG